MLCQQRLAQRVIAVHQHTQLIPNLGVNVIWVSFGYFLHPLYFGVVLLLLYRCRVYYLVVLLL
jgi:hypothetical protein